MNTFAWLQTRLTDAAITAGGLLFPPACLLCGAEVAEIRGPLICPTCCDQLKPRQASFCPKCALPYPDLPNPTGDCAECRANKPHFDAAKTLGLYQFGTRQAVLQIKHAAFEPLTMQLGKLLAEKLRSESFDPAPDIIAPVPMHWIKRLWRGTSPAENLAQTIARELRLPCISDLIRCKRFNAKQSHLPAGQRWDNVRNAYAIGWGFDIKGANVLLVDDVITTGATCSAIARELKRAGAASVYAAAVARTTFV
ncbi:double zinc ribbon domain-containing protein [Anatilimnocola floriformis]|uniref:double zinc ribbon domain-containing protein n=1 Tax=Anatilimnocola floriformis TaxID=2948575 RepID=UPI0020C21FEF|nr:double zinc ribbon domain-containing protein [Anatilimnocola floriformis]